MTNMMTLEDSGIEEDRGQFLELMNNNMKCAYTVYLLYAVLQVKFQ